MNESGKTRLSDIVSDMISNAEDGGYSCCEIGSYNGDGTKCHDNPLSVTCADEFPEYFIDSWALDKSPDDNNLELYYGTLTEEQIEMWANGIICYSSEIHNESPVIAIIHEPNVTLSENRTYDEICYALGVKKGTFSYVAASRSGTYVIYEGHVTKA